MPNKSRQERMLKFIADNPAEVRAIVDVPSNAQLSEETEARQDADETNAQAIQTAEQNRTSATSGILEALNGEIENRADGDNQLHDALNTEAATRQQADATKASVNDPRFTDARTPTGGAGGVLGGQYPNPSFAVDMATQSELDTAIGTRAPLVHNHEISSVNGLSAALSAKAESNHSHSVATTTADGFLSKEDKAKLNKLGIAAISTGTAPIPNISLLTPADVVVTLNPAMPSATYQATPSIEGTSINLGKITPTVKSQTATTVTVTLSAVININVAGTLNVLAVAKA